MYILRQGVLMIRKRNITLQSGSVLESAEAAEARLKEALEKIGLLEAQLKAASPKKSD